MCNTLRRVVLYLLLLSLTFAFTMQLIFNCCPFLKNNVLYALQAYVLSVGLNQCAGWVWYSCALRYKYSINWMGLSELSACNGLFRSSPIQLVMDQPLQACSCSYFIETMKCLPKVSHVHVARLRKLQYVQRDLQSFHAFLIMFCIWPPITVYEVLKIFFCCLYLIVPWGLHKLFYILPIQFFIASVSDDAIYNLICPARLRVRLFATTRDRERGTRWEHIVVPHFSASDARWKNAVLCMPFSLVSSLWIFT